MNRKNIIKMISFIMVLVISVSIAPISKQNVEAKKAKKNKKGSKITKVTTISSNKPIVLKQAIPLTAEEKAKKPNTKDKIIKIKNLFDIRAKEYTKDGKYLDDTNNPYNYKTVKEMKFQTLQGSCIYGDYMYIAFTDKGRKNKHEAERDLTVLAIVDLKNKLVEGVEKFYGLDTLNLYGLGHSNDLVSSENLINSAWYLHHNKKGKREKDNRIGILNKSSKYSYGGNNIVDTGLKGLIYIFGISNYENGKTILGTVIETEKKVKYKNSKNTSKNKKSKKGKKTKIITVKKFKIMSYTFKETSYEKGKKEFNLSDSVKIGKAKYKNPQCMDYKSGKFYIVRFNKKSKQDNNIVDIYKKKRHHKTVVIKDPKGWKKYKWEVECFKYYNDYKSFYYTQYQPEKKKAFLYKCKRSKLK